MKKVKKSSKIIAHSIQDIKCEKLSAKIRKTVSSLKPKKLEALAHATSKQNLSPKKFSQTAQASEFLKTNQINSFASAIAGYLVRAPT